jgi:hypothetical protein
MRLGVWARGGARRSASGGSTEFCFTLPVFRFALSFQGKARSRLQPFYPAPQ